MIRRNDLTQQTLRLTAAYHGIELPPPSPTIPCSSGELRAGAALPRRRVMQGGLAAYPGLPSVAGRVGHHVLNIRSAGLRTAAGPRSGRACV